MIQLASTATREAENVTGYFREIFEERPDLVHAKSNQELLSLWLRDHPNHTGVPDRVKRSLSNLKSLLRKKLPDGQEPGGQNLLPLPECRPAPPSLADRKDARRRDTVHDRGDTVHDRPVGARSGDRATTGGEVVHVRCERRSEPRHELRQALVAVPVLPDGSPDWDHRVGGMCVDLSPKGIGLELHAPADFPTTSLVLLLPDPDGDICSAAMEIRYTHANGAGRLRVGGPFGGFADEILPREDLIPTFHPHTMEFSLGLPDEVLRKWAEIGVLRQVLRDRVQLCPKCHGLPTFRPGCPRCGSANTTNDRLIHHFPCAHVGFPSDFETDGELICPKCRTRRLVIGSDYEYMTGPHRCLDCHWSETELEQVAQCLRCGFRFPGHQAYEQELRGYRANRLDPLALLPAPGSAPGLLGGAAVDRCAPLRPEQDHSVLVGLRA